MSQPEAAPPTGLVAPIAGTPADVREIPDLPDRPDLSGRSRVGRRLLTIGLWTLAVVLTLAIVATGLVVWSIRRAFPQHGGQIALPGLSAPVNVYRDAYGIPQVYAANAADLFRAQGYVHAQDRFWEMDARRHVTSGRLAELFGADLVPTDAFLRTLGWRRVAEQEWQLISAETRGYLSAYAEGVNAWIAETGGAKASGAKSLEYSVLGLSNGDYTVEQWDPIDSLAWLKAMAWDLRGNMDSEMGRAILLGHGLTRTQVEQLYPAYPFARNRPILATGAVVGGAFNPAPVPALAPTSLAPAATPAGSAGLARTDLTSPQAAQVVTLLSDAIRALPGTLGRAGDSTGIGSNSWVIGGGWTVSGKPLLANDPHLSPSMPGIWYQIGLHCECEFNVEGFSFSGVPGIVIGHNARVAWGFTNLDPDVTDLYLERLDGDRALDGTQWVALTKRTEEIKVAGADPVTITVRTSKHGPLLSDRSQSLLTIAARPPVNPSGSPLASASPGPTPSLDAAAPGVPPATSQTPYAVALRWTALDPGRTIEALFAVDKAASFADFRAAAALFEVPAQNMVYADVDGNIGYQSPGRIPIRGNGDGEWPAPGWDPSYDWKGFIPFEQLPSVFNPPDGWIVTANQAVIGEQYQNLLTHDWAYGYRSQRIMDMLQDRLARGKIAVEDVRQMQFDNRNGNAATLVPALLAASTDGKAPVGLLRDWDFQQPAYSPPQASAAAAFFNATWLHLLLRTFDEVPVDRLSSGDDRWFETVRALLDQPNSRWWDDRRTPAVESRDEILRLAMTDAVNELSRRFGPDASGWRWGDLHTLELVNATFGESGIAPIEWLFNRGPAGTSGGGAIVNATGWSPDKGYQVDAVPSMRMIVDMSNLDASRWIQLTGNSGHAFHPNYADQFELWRVGANLPMRWDRSTIEAEARHTLTLHP